MEAIIVGSGSGIVALMLFKHRWVGVATWVVAWAHHQWALLTLCGVLIVFLAFEALRRVRKKPDEKESEQKSDVIDVEYTVNKPEE